MVKKRFELLIFDLDGTLIDSQHDLADAVNAVRAGYGFNPLSLPVLRSYIGDGVTVLIERALKGIDSVEIPRAVARFEAAYDARLLSHTVLYPGVRETLDRVADKQLAVLTNKSEAFAVKILSSLGILDDFASIRGGDTGSHRKPSPEPILEIARQAKANLGSTIMIGDGVNDILAAHAAGIASVALTCGYTDPAALRALSPEYLVDRFDALTDIIA